MTHPLIRYLAETPGETQTSLALRAGVSRMTIWRIIHDGGVAFTTTLLRKVADATGGKVTAGELADAEPEQDGTADDLARAG